MSVGLLDGLAGGAVATTVATALFALAGQERPLPAARLCARALGDGGRPSDALWTGLVVHSVAGILAGAVFAAVVAAGAAPVDLPTRVAWGVGYGLVLFAVHVGGVVHGVLGVRADREALAEFLVLHVVYGTVLGAWMGLGL